MLAGRITSVTYGAQNKLVVEMEGNAGEFSSSQRVLVAIIPDDTQIQRAYERGKAEGVAEERWAFQAFLERRQDRF